ncbi:uncharacterized protein [Phyllobates terribilis]|uniref:uncharacterized protein n=1 Tax=Phyllobates terribilis TaxID=111132 RepID=UPI003CCAAFCA
MASLGSFLFQLDGASATEGSSSARSPVLATIRRGKPLESLSFRNSGNGGLRAMNVASERSVRLFRRTGSGSQMIARLKAAGKDSVGGDKEIDTEDSVQEIIQKGKRVLAVQKELLEEFLIENINKTKLLKVIMNHELLPISCLVLVVLLVWVFLIAYNYFQIAERRKRVASIKSDMNNQESGNSSIISTISASSIEDSVDSRFLDEEFVFESAPSIPVKLPETPTSSFNANTPPELVEVSMNSSHLGSVVGDEVMNTTPDSLSMDFDSSERLIKIDHLSTFENLLGSMYEPAPVDENPGPLAGENVMNIILVAAECSPFSKTGGLGDVAGSLPKALARRGHRVMVVVPKYGDYHEAQRVGELRRYKVAGQDMEVAYFHSYIDGVDFVFIESAMFRGIESNIYGGSRQDVFKRMVLFCKAAIEVPWHVPCGGIVYGDGNLVFIANDWHTALLPVYLKAYYRDNGLMTYTRSVLVIHNIAHQGRAPMDDFPIADLPDHWRENFRFYDPVGGEHCNVFAAGLKAADRVVTVSHGYAWELKTQEGGWGLHNIISECDWKFRGIVNGVDTNEWSPQTDIHLQSDGYTNYSLETLRSGKSRCKSALQDELGLPRRDDVLMIGFIGRLDGQKGVDIIADAIPWMMSQDVQLVMLGTGRPDLEQMLKRFEGQYNDKARGWVGFSVKMAHRITAGVDILLMPSRFEPCGLNQLYAMNYGTIPVVHAVGGLRDTVLPFDPFNDTGLGWTFDRAESGKLIDALGNVLVTYREYKESWEGIQRRGMSQDFSWDHAAEIYEEVLVAAKYQW